MIIYINRDGTEFGPYSFEEVRDYAKDGGLQPNDLAWYEGCQDWILLARLPGVFVAPPPVPARLTTPLGEPAEMTLSRRIGEYLHVSGVIWIVLGILQIISIFGIIAGAWNIYAGITRFRAADLATSRDYRTVKCFENISGLVVIAIINLLFGGVIGLILVGFDFFIRDKIIKNAHLFTFGLPTGSRMAPMRVVTPNRQILAPAAPPMGILLPPKDQTSGE